jgi:hypothetical protein
MKAHDSHIGDGELLLAAGGEVSATRASAIRRHLADCRSCRMRHARLEQTIADVVEAHHREYDGELPPMDASRRWLRARLAQAAEKPRPRAWHPPVGMHWPRHRLAWAAAAFLLAGVGAMLAGWPAWIARVGHAPEREFAPNAALTPGGVRPLSRDAVCAAADREELGPAISASVAREVFRRYGIRNPRPRSYEVDYLIPPALGGSGDPRNLWPQPYSAGVWNARVKDALEDRLRALVCEGNLDLATAQRDLARDWIAAYKKYFRTGTPLVDHVAFVKDRPWE